MIPFALLILACDDAATVAEKQGVQEYDDTSNIPTPSDDADEVVADDTEDMSVGPITYSFNDTDSLIYVQVFKDLDALGSSLAHDHVIRATGWTGSVTLDLDNPSDCTLEFIVPVDLLSVDEDGMRDLVGYGDSISSSDRAAIRDHMLDDSQLNVSRHDSIVFSATDCAIEDDTLVTAGALTVAGGTARMDIVLDMVISDEQLYLQGDLDTEHADFGMTPFSAYGGLVRNDDPLPFVIDIVGTPSL